MVFFTHINRENIKTYFSMIEDVKGIVEIAQIGMQSLKRGLFFDD